MYCVVVVVVVDKLGQMWANPSFSSLKPATKEAAKTFAGTGTRLTLNTNR
jgi:hypothetical protein